MYGYREIDGHCVDCLTWEEAMDIAVIYANASGQRYKVEGEHIQHFRGRNISRQNEYCWHTMPLGESIGNSKNNGRALRRTERDTS